MGYERDGRGMDPRRDDYRRREEQDYGRDYRDMMGRDMMGRDESGRDYQGGDRGYGARDHGFERYAQRDRMNQGGGWGDQQRGWTAEDREGGGQGFTGGRDFYRADRESERGGRRVGVYSGGPQGGGPGGGDRHEERGRDADRQQRGGHARQPQGQGGDDRGFMARAGDEVRSWFGDEEAERRREMDDQRDHAGGGYGRDEHYRHWRNQQMASFDRDYHDYREENQSKFHNEFAAFRTERQGQRDMVGKVTEHAEVVGSDGEHVGTVDKVRGDRIILTKTDTDAGGRHHSIPSRWLQTADGGKVTLRKTAQEAKDHWRDEERQQESRGAMFGEREEQQSGEGGADGDGGRINLNRSFSGTY